MDTLIFICCTKNFFFLRTDRFHLLPYIFFLVQEIFLIVGKFNIKPRLVFGGKYIAACFICIPLSLLTLTLSPLYYVNSNRKISFRFTNCLWIIFISYARMKIIKRCIVFIHNSYLMLCIIFIWSILGVINNFGVWLLQ